MLCFVMFCNQCCPENEKQEASSIKDSQHSQICQTTPASGAGMILPLTVVVVILASQVATGIGWNYF